MFASPRPTAMCCVELLRSIRPDRRQRCRHVQQFRPGEVKLMNARDAIKTALTSTQFMLGKYLEDLSDADLLVRPVPNANHVAWQLGHLAAAERQLGAQIPGAAYPELPAGWAEQHNKTTASIEPAKGFATKAEYLAQLNKGRDATLAALAKLSDADLDKPTEGS